MNNQLWIAFITGLTTGGLSCVALQGGLLASVILDEEKEYLSDKKNRKVPKVRPVVLFLVAKLVAYTILGFLLGFFGSFISLSPVVRGWLQILIGIFMVGLAINILDVHPIFRYFSIQPPAFIRKFIRKQTRAEAGQAKNSGDLGALFMGTLTVLLPCAITQAMMLLAIASGSGPMGAAIMFSFILGTLPLFFILGVTTTTLSERLSNIFQKAVAILVLIVAGFSIYTGATLAGISISSNKTDCTGSECPVADSNTGVSADMHGKVQEITINLKDTGYDPATIRVKKGIPVKVNLKTNRTYSCIQAFVVPSLNIQKVLTQTDTKSFTFTPQKAGQIDFTCSMGMYNGSFIVE